MFQKKKLFMILISLIILVGLIGFSVRERTNVTMVEKFIHDSVGWIQEIVNMPVSAVMTFSENIQDIRNVYEENQRLKSNLENLRQLEYKNQELSQEMEELEAILDKSETDFLQNFDAIQASVIARSKEQWFQQITINKGTDDGIQKNMAVITGQGMIGKVQTTSPFSSTVLLLNGFDNSNRISVNVDQGDSNQDMSGFILGYNEERELLELELNENDQQVEAGHMVFSSGLGGMFPKGLEIGEIQEVSEDQYDLAQVALVEPSADLEDVQHVMVIDRAADTVNTTTEEEEE
ncbi:rod shape-determining protein MreC [Gracilibacillus halophilus YIM-C55.5]|uniref:Cell shape-determining protein MreC n=1 Tax=Gracilibacillus halophilus YIM-C55.5 TaxID=1308866 RepID=N4WPA2_9BACI|nr:rod shape-determining protein MreC [Gracilibacillus halophilus]ENH97952.1 rod shape-determining protein MreC [Gracilibacillus halophilus YIM-C55.5]